MASDPIFRTTVLVRGLGVDDEADLGYSRLMQVFEMVESFDAEIVIPAAGEHDLKLDGIFSLLLLAGRHAGEEVEVVASGAADAQEALDVMTNLLELGLPPDSPELTRPIRPVDLAGCDLRTVDLPGSLGRATLRRSVLSNRHLDDATLYCSDLREARLARASLRGSDLERARLDGACLHGAVLRGANLKNASLIGADLTSSDLTGADLRGAQLQEADLHRAVLKGARLEGARLSRARLQAASLDGVNLRGARLDAADLSHAGLRGADLITADFSSAMLREADLEQADCRDATLDGADLTGARTGTANFRRASRTGALYDPESVKSKPLRVLLVESVLDSRTRERRRILRRSPRLATFSLAFCALYLMKPRQTWKDAAYRLGCAVRDQWPDILLIHMGTTFRSHPEEFLALLNSERARYPHLKIAVERPNDDRVDMAGFDRDQTLDYLVDVVFGR